MRLIFIRHGEPNYELDTLTPKGWREAELLSERVVRMENVREYYCSPLGRARDTASLSMKRLGKEARICGWLEEFHADVKDPQTGMPRIPWDFMPSQWTGEPLLYDKDQWYHAPVMRTGNVEERYQWVCSGLDGLLAEHGYVREGNTYRTAASNSGTLVFFCHFGVTMVMLSHLLGIAAPLLWQGCMAAPASVTEMITEEREKGTAYFRCTRMGDVSHLYTAGEIPSCAGLFQEDWD